jgi:hypothetical protein
MGVARRSVRTGIVVGIASTSVAGSLVSIAGARTAGVEVHQAVRPVAGVATSAVEAASPSVMPGIETGPVGAWVGPTVVEAVEASVVVDVPEADVSAVPAGRIDRVVLLGDSLADEASSVIRYLTAGTEMLPRYFGGTAPCDWFDHDLGATATAVVVISFTGNNDRDCMRDAAGVPMVDEELVEKYAADVRVLVDRATAAGAWVLLVGQPRHAPVLDADVEIEGLNAAYRQLAATVPRVSFVDAGHHVETPDGRYTDRLPCTVHDTDCAPDGTTVVRGDGVHFCPVVLVNPCPVWSSGAVRFGGAIAAAINDPSALE